MTKFHVTYDVVTYESAEHGDYEEIGYAMPHGWHFKLEDMTKEDVKACELSLREALNMMGCVEDTGSWFVETSGWHNYQTGAETRYSLHPPENITNASYSRLKRLLNA